MNLTLTRKIGLWILVAFLLVHLCLAVGIRPAKTELASDDTKKYEGEFWIVNNDQKEFKVNVYVEGEMAQYVEIDKKQLMFREDDDALSIKFKVNLPETVPPGTSTANIVVEEKLSSEDKEVISSKVVLKHKIVILGPYPDKYISVKLNFQQNRDNIRLISEVENKGKLDLDQVQTTFYVNDQKQKQHAAETEQVPLKKAENKLLTAELKTDLFNKGEFEVSAVTKYDDQKIEVIKNLIVGEPEVEVVYFDKYFIANKINQYSMDLMNKWNRKVENVFVDVDIKKEGQKIDSFRTKSVEIEGLVTERINDYLDARDKSVGKYSFEMAVNFWNTYRMTQKTFQGEIITEEEFKTLNLAPPPGLAGKATGDNVGNISSVLLWILAGIIICIAGVYVAWRYKHRGEYE